MVQEMLVVTFLILACMIMVEEEEVEPAAGAEAAEGVGVAAGAGVEEGAEAITGVTEEVQWIIVTL